MSQCPYQETIVDEDNDTEVVDDRYFAWHEGYEAHKCDIATWSIQLKQELEREITKAKQLEVELIAKYYEAKNKLVDK